MSDLRAFLDAGPCTEVRVAEVRGSSPREAGAFMLVRGDALWGTIGGGQLEYMAIDEARALARSGALSREMDVPLGPEIGQCCGGRVRLALRAVDAARARELMREDAARREALPEMLIFGAGHVGRALARALEPLPVKAKLIDSRAGELARYSGDVQTCLSAIPEAELRAAGKGAAYVIATHDHALDFLLASEALERGDAAYAGMIGSKTKRARFESWHAGDAGALICPMAAAMKGDRRPEVIAAFVAAEVLAALGAMQPGVKPFVDMRET